MKRSILFWLYFVIAIILAIYFSTRIIMTGLGYGSAAKVRSRSISTDSKDKDLTAVATAAAVAPGTKSYDINLSETNQRINDVPGVK